MTQAAHANSPQDRPRCPAFVPGTLDRQLRNDALLRWFTFFGLAVGLGSAAALQTTGWLLSLLLFALAIVGWGWMSAVSARVMRTLPRLTVLLERNAPAAEAYLAEAIRRRPLQRWVRLLLYHRLAVLRMRQHRFEETAAICASLLRQRLGGARQVRPHLLLMLAEARLQSRDVVGAWQAIHELHGQELGLIERLQLMRLQLAYHLMAQQPAEALANLPGKLWLSDAMPAAEAAQAHRMLAEAARRVGRADLVQWFEDRAKLLDVDGAARPLPY